MRRSTINQVLGRSALSSYRADLPLGGASPAEIDGDTIIVATLLRHAVSATQTAKDRTRIVREATRLAKVSLGKAALARGCAFDPPGRKADLDVLRLIAERTEQRGSLEMAANLFEALAALARPGSLTAGRILAERARNARKRGYLDLAKGQLATLLRQARRQGSAELHAQALIGLGALSQLAGNYPAMRRHLLAAARVAERHGLSRLASTALSGLATQTAISGDLNRAAGLAWRGFLLSAGDARSEQGLLLVLGQILLKAGHPQPARDALHLLLTREPPLRLALPALGGLAQALSETEDAAGVHSAARRVGVLIKSRGHYREAASALIDCAQAFARIGQLDRAATLRRRAIILASNYGFHDLVHDAEQQAVAAFVSREPVRLTRGALAAAKWVDAAAPERPRADLEFEVADT